MDFFRKQWISLLFLIAIPASFVISHHDSAKRDAAQDRAAAAQVKAQITGCVSSSRRSAFQATLAQQLHDRVSARGNKGDAESASDYLAVGTSIVKEIVATTPSKHIADVVRVGDHYVLTPEAAALQMAGCVARYTK